MLLLGLLCLPGRVLGQTGTEPLAAANTGFAFGLVRELVRERPAANIFVSPYSVSAVLQMVNCGARGQTQAELAQALGSTNLSQSQVNQAYREVAESLQAAQSNAVLTVANAVWYRTGTQLLPEFTAVNRDFYRATLETLDFSNPATPGIINGWVDKNTQGKIKNLVSGPISSQVRVMLANAVYFKGTWEHKFDPKETQDQPFHLAGGRDKKTPMMRRRGDFAYQATDQFQAVRLPYLGGHLGMFVVLPATNSSPEQVLNSFDLQGWQTLARGFRNAPGTLVLPRFKLEYEAELNKPLGALGVKLAFTDHADFSGMSSEPLYLSEVKHKTYVDVNEVGTEAAAATIAIMRAASVMRPQAPFEMVVDRPFVFAILDEPTQTILFLGVLKSP